MDETYREEKNLGNNSAVGNVEKKFLVGLSFALHMANDPVCKEAEERENKWQEAWFAKKCVCSYFSCCFVGKICMYWGCLGHLVAN